MSTAATAEAPATIPFDASGLFDDAQPNLDESAEVAESPDVEEQPDADDEPTSLADEDDGPQPGDDLDEPAAEAPEVAQGESQQIDMGPGLTGAENTLVEIWNAERKCISAEAEVEDLKEQLKEAKARYDNCVSHLRKLARAAELDRDRPLLVEKPDAVQGVEEPVVAAEAATDAPSEGEPLQPGEVRIRLLADIEEGDQKWEKGAVIVARVDNAGDTFIPTPTADNPDDGPYLEAKEFELLEDGAAADVDARLDTPLAETAIPPGLIEKLAEHKITTVRELAAFTAEKQLTDIKGIGQGKAEKIEDAMEAFWASSK